MNGIINHIRERLCSAYDPDEALALAYWIVEERTALTRSDIIVGREVPNIPDLDGIIDRLLHHEPIQYIFGHTAWMGLDLLVSPATLIPRPETAELLRLLPTTEEPLRVLDIGTGSGCIAIAVKRAHPTWQVSAIDISADALAIAKENARRCDVDIDFHQVDILSNQVTFPLPFLGKGCRLAGGEGALVISNPPYIMESERASMSPNVLEHEPHTALFVPDNDPLLFYRRIAQLHWAPALLFEINEALGSKTAAMLRGQGYTDVTIVRDSYGKERFITARIPE